MGSRAAAPSVSKHWCVGPGSTRCVFHNVCLVYDAFEDLRIKYFTHSHVTVSPGVHEKLADPFGGHARALDEQASSLLPLHALRIPLGGREVLNDLTF